MVWDDSAIFLDMEFMWRKLLQNTLYYHVHDMHEATQLNTQFAMLAEA